ncbi:TRAP transporter small permease subunit [Seohaeicola saemankumensis]|uniref:TRAP transporter small permease protein n=1 Tax=Seohaeicola saemankumensis TaxID=481181 RepID=A0ABW3TBR6_9RHOB
MSLADNRHETSRVIRGWHLVVEAFAAIGTLLIGVLMLIICADIVARNLMGASLPLVSEGGALLVVTLVALQLAATVRAGRLARAEFFLNAVENRSPRAAAALHAAFNAIGAGVLGTIAWATIRVLEKDVNAAEFIGINGMGTLPTWPFRALILAGFAIAAIEFVIATLGALRSVIKART